MTDIGFLLRIDLLRSYHWLGHTDMTSNDYECPRHMYVVHHPASYLNWERVLQAPTGDDPEVGSFDQPGAAGLGIFRSGCVHVTKVDTLRYADIVLYAKNAPMTDMFVWLWPVPALAIMST